MELGGCTRRCCDCIDICFVASAVRMPAFSAILTRISCAPSCCSLPDFVRNLTYVFIPTCAHAITLPLLDDQPTCFRACIAQRQADLKNPCIIILRKYILGGRSRTDPTYCYSSCGLRCPTLYTTPLLKLQAVRQLCPAPQPILARCRRGHDEPLDSANARALHALMPCDAAAIVTVPTLVVPSASTETAPLVAADPLNVSAKTPSASPQPACVRPARESPLFSPAAMKRLKMHAMTSRSGSKERTGRGA